MHSTFNVFVIFALFKLFASLPIEDRNTAVSLDLSRFGADIYNTPSELAGRNLKDWTKSGKKGNPEEQGPYFEGDIMLDVETRNGVILEARKWKDGKIPYEIKGSFSKLICNHFYTSSKSRIQTNIKANPIFNFPAQQQKNLLSDAIEQFKKHTCIRFYPRASEEDRVVFVNNPTGCWSHVGKTGGAQPINLQVPGCMGKVGTVMHEILHAVGMYHEQNRFDRNKYVKINFNNIAVDKHINFEMLSETEISSYGVDYDINSVLHYSAYAFASNPNSPTIESRTSSALTEKMGQRDGFSKGDIEKINAMYCQNVTH